VYHKSIPHKPDENNGEIRPMTQIYPALIFRITTGFLLVMQTTIRLWITRQKQPTTGSRFAHKERELFFIRLSGTAMLMAYVYVFFPDTKGLDFSFPVPLRLAGAILMFAGNILFLLAHVYLGKQWSAELEIQPGHQLIINGIYRWIRHPMYTGFLVFGLGLLLLFANILGCAYFPAVAIMIYFRLPSEEALLIDEFGEEYVEYRKTTSALIPGLY
jgi:protein-S-isoprenylcysteine O-methyltransferase Ste14